MEKFVYKYQQLSKRLKYNDIDNQKCNTKLIKKYHIGQIKLLISEIMFLTKFHNKATKVVYVGAARGWHISFLADLFKNMHFDLYDQREMINENRPNVTKYQKLFDDSDTDKYKSDGQNVLFMSDIRSMDELENAKREANQNNMTKLDNIVNMDGFLQKKWVQEIQPLAAFLKFRLGYSEGKTNYLKGKIYLQPYSPISTESRLLTTNYDDLIEYDNTEFDEKLAYFNCFIRPTYKDAHWSKIMEKHKIKNNWDNSYAFYVLSAYADKVESNQDMNYVGDLFMRMIRYLEKENPKKYNILFYTQ